MYQNWKKVFVVILLVLPLIMLKEVQAGEKNPCGKNPCAMKNPCAKNPCAAKNPCGMKNPPFPKYLKMPNDILTLDQMINFCMINPMKGKALKWNSSEITAIAAYVQANAKEEGEPANPCAMKHPCGRKHPCGMKNPCGGK